MRLHALEQRVVELLVGLVVERSLYMREGDGPCGSLALAQFQRMLIRTLKRSRFCSGTMASKAEPTSPDTLSQPR